MSTERDVQSKNVNRAVQQYLSGLVDRGQETGIQVCAYLHGDAVVDAWGGGRQQGEAGMAVDGRTLFPIFSVIKGVINVAAHVQVEKGMLDLDAPIASYWPEFAVNGKQAITLRDVFAHRAGLPQMPEGLTPTDARDWDKVVERIAALEPYHAPGAQSFYHALTYGWLIGEAVRRTDPAGRALDIFVQQEICQPLGIDSLFLLVPKTERGRMAQLHGAPYPEGMPDEAPLRVGIPAAFDLFPALFNQAEVQATLLPAVGGYANARSVARLFALLANGGQLDGVRLLSEQRVRDLSALRPGSDAPDPFLGGPARLSMGGFMLGGSKRAVGSNPGALFSVGAGGSIAWADGETGLAVSITHNRMYYGVKPEDDPQVAIGELIRRELGLSR